jgi:hypothetical protein
MVSKHEYFEHGVLSSIPSMEKKWYFCWISSWCDCSDNKFQCVIWTMTWVSTQLLVSGPLLYHQGLFSDTLLEAIRVFLGCVPSVAHWRAWVVLWLLFSSLCFHMGNKIRGTQTRVLSKMVLLHCSLFPLWIQWEIQTRMWLLHLLRNKWSIISLTAVSVS